MAARAHQPTPLNENILPKPVEGGEDKGVAGWLQRLPAGPIWRLGSVRWFHQVEAKPPMSHAAIVALDRMGSLRTLSLTSGRQ